MTSFLLSRRAFIASLSATLATGGRAFAAAIGAADLDRVARVAIHPAIGVARVGNSRDAFFFGPEVPGALPAGPFKDPTGAVARQAARFRLFGYDADGRVVGELTAADVDVTWRVAVANAKAAWYEVDVAFDVEGAPGAARRNGDVTDRSSLIVRASPRTLEGAGAAPVPLDGGAFMTMPVTLGEAMTDASGRLVVLAGAGGAYRSPEAPPMAGFADNSGWTDDTCDGPVGATVRIGGRTFEADPAWVLCVPPNYAPGIASSIVTVYDAVESALVTAGIRSATETVFERDVWPIFRRMSDLQWVNEGFFQRYGFDAPRDFLSEAWRARLADGSPENAPLRQSLLALFRDPTFVSVQPDAEPMLFGDKAEVPPDAIEPRQWLALTPLQHRRLADWAAGAFRLAGEAEATRLEDLALAERPAALDRAALDACIGGAFHPGIEFPWIVRTPWIWTAGMRLATTAADVDVTDYGDTLTTPVATARTGPLSRLGPGSFTHWMGVPWHADASSCRFGYEPAISPVLPGFWPARIPNGVLAEVDYRIVMDTARTLDDRRAAFPPPRGGGFPPPPPPPADPRGDGAGLVPPRHDRRPAGPRRRRLSGDDEGRDRRRLRPRAGGALSAGGAVPPDRHLPARRVELRRQQPPPCRRRVGGDGDGPVDAARASGGAHPRPRRGDLCLLHERQRRSPGHGQRRGVAFRRRLRHPGRHHL
ncbi:MAG TPA: LodA/GoxA family CTQ-dependent oxidase [Bauldia sp.]|nr:LodA/GoxA family CTQ-dependent oxidase [Bauldia sp.]